MKIEIVMPQMGESIAEGTIIKWWKKPGDKVEKDEILFEISTDKVDTEIPSPAEGVFTEIVISESITVDIGTVVGYIETDADSAEIKTEKPVPVKKVEITKDDGDLTTEKAPVIEKVKHVGKPDKKSFFSPVVMKIVKEEGIEFSALETISGTGSGGRITKKDVLANLDKLRSMPAGTGTAAPAKPISDFTPPKIDFTTEGTKIVPMDNMRSMIADHMINSVKTSPHVSAFSEVDMTAISKYREKENDAFKSREGFSLNYTAFIAKALVLAAQDFPEINSSIDGKNIIYRKNVNLGIAVALDKGLLVPVVRNSEEKTLTGLARSINDLGNRARNKQLNPDEVQGSTITMTNFGIFGNLFGTPIINQPNVAILGIGVIKKRPVVINDAIAIRNMMFISLTFDHRIIDGALGGRCLEKIVEYLQDVDSLTR